MNQRNYYRILLGRKNCYAEKCFSENFIGVHYGIDQDLSNDLPEDWREFNHNFKPIYLEKHPEKSKVAAGLACGTIHTVSKAIQQGDIVFCPDGEGSYRAGEVISDYYYEPDGILPHRRKVSWLPITVARKEMSKALQNSTGSIGTCCNITKYGEELEGFLAGAKPLGVVATDDSIEDPTVFALEKHLEEFLVANWNQTELGRDYNIYEEEGEIIGQQFPVDTGNIDILAISKDGKELLVVELKKGRASDVVVGQIQRYMGYVKDELAETGQSVVGVIVAFEDDLKIRRALSVTNGIQFYRYEVNFKLFKEL